jgi:hypothetical protein
MWQYYLLWLVELVRLHKLCSCAFITRNLRLVLLCSCIHIWTFGHANTNGKCFITRTSYSDRGGQYSFHFPIEALQSNLLLVLGLFWRFQCSDETASQPIWKITWFNHLVLEVHYWWPRLLLVGLPASENKRKARYRANIWQLYIHQTHLSNITPGSFRAVGWLLVFMTMARHQLLILL